VGGPNARGTFDCRYFSFFAVDQENPASFTFSLRAARQNARFLFVLVLV
jgi:uncharacterized alpha-E superfamily protein